MRLNRIVISALLVASVAGPALAQPDRYDDPRQDQYDDDRWRDDRDADRWRDDRDDDRYDRYDRYDYDRDQGPEIDIGFFYGELSPYGEWVRHPQYGWSWFPRHVHAGWRPYSLGRWAGSDYGWTWISDEPFGWATYHYGRWAWDRQLGWLWVPGTDWGPAWVAWQQGNGYVGWAPLPPRVGFDLSFGIRLGGFNLSVGIAPRDYTFVEERRFLDARIATHIVPQARNVTIIHNTTNITNYTVINNRVINHGVPIDRIEQATGRRAARMRIANVDTLRSAGVQRDVINVYRPSDRRLETVRVGRRNNAGQPQGLPQPSLDSRGPTGRPHAIAPRVRPAVQTDYQRQFRRENQDLKANQDRERRNLEQIHRREMTQAPAQVNRQEVSRRHAAELDELKALRPRAERQLQTRQEIERRAAQATVKDQKPAKPAKAVEHGGPKKDKKHDGSDDSDGNDGTQPAGSF